MNKNGNVFEILEYFTNFLTKSLISDKVLSKKSRQAGHTQIWLLLKKQSDLVLQFCYSEKHFAYFSPENQHKV